MSLINQMLQDLDKRRATTSEAGALSLQVKPLHQDRRANPKIVIAGLGAMLVAAGGIAAWLYSPSTVTPSGHLSVATAQSLPSAPKGTEASAPVLPSGPSPENPPLPKPSVEKSAGLRLDGDLATPVSASKNVSSQPPVATGTPQTVKTPTPVASSVAVPVAAVDKRSPFSGALPVATAAVAGGAGPASIDKQPRLGTPRERAEQEYRRGIAALNLGRQGDAQGALRAALKEDPVYQEARQLLLKLLVEQRSLDEARQLLSEGLLVVPSQVSWIMTLARLQIETGDAKAAWATLEAGLSYGRNSSEYQGFTGGVLHRLQRESEAADAYRAALRLAPNDGRWWLGLGLALEAAGAAGEARQAFQNARASGSLSPEMTAFVDQRLR